MRFTKIPDEIKKMAKEISSRRFYRCKGLSPTILQKILQKEAIRTNEISFAIDQIKKEHAILMETPEFSSKQASNDHYGIIGKSF